ncbi:auxin-responsive protein SAUR65-like [Prunus dulcis]|uniref:auxin-responsive protein SAUR65-like n=1 Tax=Prunus dulcis TaxID=3755 RepID=UPI0014832E89|nr:auxin-responsive protein SAUR65-like [Prunus dulcis]
MVSEKGTFVIYTIDERRFVLPLSYLSHCIFQELFKMSEEEFGLSSGSGTIILPCDSLFMNYMVSLLQRGMTGDLEKALLANSLFSIYGTIIMLLELSVSSFKAITCLTLT